MDFNTIFHRCVEDSSDAIMISDSSGVLVYVNPAWCRIYGYSQKQAIGSTPKLLHSGLQSPDFYREMWETIRDPLLGHWRGELVNRAKDGTMVPVLLTITGFKGLDGTLSGYMGIAVDLTYRKELESKVAHQDRLASIGLLASGLAHEIGTPLGVVRGRAEFILMQTEDPKIKKSLEIITSQIDRISKLIRSLLRISRGSSQIQMEWVRVQSVVEEVLALVGQNIKQDSAQIILEIPDDFEVHGDFGRIEQILINLIMNATHAIRKAIQSGRIHGHYVKITATALDQGRSQICVEDSGCGIAPKAMGKLFQPFFTTKEVGEGTGLGLAIVSQLTTEMNGTINVKSTEDLGTVFTLNLRSG